MKNCIKHIHTAESSPAVREKTVQNPCETGKTKLSASPLSDIIDSEDAEVKTMKKQIEVKQRQLRVKEAIKPYIRSDKVPFVYDSGRDRYKFRVPVALRRDDKEKLTAKTEDELYEKLYLYLFGDEKYTVRLLFEEALAEMEKCPDRASITIDRYRQIWAKHYEGNPIADAKITDLKASDLKKFFRQVTADRSVTRKNFVNIKSVLNISYDIAVDADIIAGNTARAVSCKDLRFKAVDNSNIRYTDNDRTAILEYLDEMEKKSDYEYGIVLMFCLCMRIGELRALRWTDWDRQHHTIRIAREIVLRKNDKGKKRFIEVNHTKGGEHGERVLPLSDRAERVLEDLRQAHPNSEYICCNQARQPLDGNKFNKHLKRVTGAIGIPYLSSHKIRFWSVTALARATGGDIQSVMYAAGHADKNTTLHYIRAVKSDTQTEAIRACFG